MTVGLPLSGKSEWVREWMKNNSAKRYYVLSGDLLMDRMKHWLLPDTRDTSLVPNLAEDVRQHIQTMLSFRGQLLNGILAQIKNNPPRNYIIDAANITKAARDRKLDFFDGYRSKIAVLFTPPS